MSSNSNNANLPLMANRLYNYYSIDGLDFALHVLKEAQEHLDRDYPDTSVEEKSKMKQILRLECIAKFCQMAENMAAIALAFKSTYSDEKSEVLGIYDTLAKYEVGHVINFYEEISKRNVGYIAKIMGYPPLDLQDSQVREHFTTSSEEFRNWMSAIGQEYTNLRRLYDANKHGYRVAFGKHVNTDDAFGYVETDTKKKIATEKVMVVSDEAFNRIVRLASKCREIIESMFMHHRMRVMYEEYIGGDEPLNLNYNIISRPSQGATETKTTLKVMYPTRGDRLKKDSEEGDMIYESFKEDLEKNHPGKFVAIDIDARKIVALDYDREKVLSEGRRASTSARIRIRRVGKDERTGLEIY